MGREVSRSPNVADLVDTDVTAPAQRLFTVLIGTGELRMIHSRVA